MSELLPFDAIIANNKHKINQQNLTTPSRSHYVA